MIIGKEGISAHIIADSISPNGHRMTTFELEYPRIILAEVNTHKMLNKNSASSRAIPFKKMMDNITTNPAMPVFWGKNQAGMSAAVELEGDALIAVKDEWMAAIQSAIEHSKRLDELGLHKQITNRVAEFGQRMKTVMSGTEYANLWWLRDHDAAQPEFHELARCMHEEYQRSVPSLLLPGQWHLPYVETAFDDLSGEIGYFDGERRRIDLATAQKISASCCAQVSYRKLDDSEAKALDIYEKLVGADRKHASPFEHLATPIGDVDALNDFWPEGITHMDRNGKLWSANLQGFIQYRKLIPGEAVW
jgi:hypothetical protein